MATEEEVWLPCEWRMTRGYLLVSYLILGGVIMAFIAQQVAFRFDVFFAIFDIVVISVLALVIATGFGISQFREYDRGHFVPGEYSLMRGELFLRLNLRLDYIYFRPKNVDVVDSVTLAVKGTWWKGNYDVRLPTEEECASLLFRLKGLLSPG